jgi:hypothetical protein
MADRTKEWCCTERMTTGDCRCRQPITPPNKPNSSPGMSEVGLVVGALAANLEIPTDQLIELQATGNLTTTAYLIVQALSTKNELPSEVERTVNYLWQAAKAASETLRMMAEAKTARQTDRDDYPELAATGYSWPKPEETYEYKAAQTILSLQRRLESVAQFALDLAGGRVMGDGLDELRRRADAALNPKDTGR